MNLTDGLIITTVIAISLIVSIPLGHMYASARAIRREKIERYIKSLQRKRGRRCR